LNKFNKQITGRVLEIQRMSTEDGPGLRTTVFLKGCTLNCSWCHNPESIDPRFEVQWVATSCIGCLTCVDLCESNALSTANDQIVINRDLCTGCGCCTEECPSTAIELIGSVWTAEDLVDELVKDRAFFENSDGGITLSGGELTMQSNFCSGVLKGLKEFGLNTAIDTCGHCSESALEKLLPHADLVLFDLKEMGRERHRDFTGKSNEIILKNLEFVSEWTNKNAKTLWIRTPVIPGSTMDEANINAMGKFIAKNLNGRVTRWELCTFNNLCRDKYTRLGLEWKHGNDELISENDIIHLAEVAEKSGVNPGIVHWSGSTRSD
jgi:pyruvate formate lyase activating enzyme